MAGAGDAQEGKDVRFPDGKSTVSGTLYMYGEGHKKLLNTVYSEMAHTNPMHGDVFPSVRRMEAEVVNMTASLLGGGASSAALFLRAMAVLITAGLQHGDLQQACPSMQCKVHMGTSKLPKMLRQASWHEQSRPHRKLVACGTAYPVAR